MSLSFDSLKLGLVKRAFSTSLHVLGAAAVCLLAMPRTSAADVVVVRRGPLFVREFPRVIVEPLPVVRPIEWVQPAPPAAIVVPVPVPRPGWIWSPGYWCWTGGIYVWTAGVWLPERRGFGYVPAHWQRLSGRWFFASGRWVRRPL